MEPEVNRTERPLLLAELYEHIFFNWNIWIHGSVRAICAGDSQAA